VPFPEYNRLFLQNLSIVGLGTAIAPIVLFLGAFDGRYNNINTVVSQVLGSGWHNTFIFTVYLCLLFTSLFNTDWDISYILHIGICIGIRIGDHCYHGSSVGSVQDLGASNIFVNSQGTVNYLTVGAA
jgi:hypothetical protein